MAAATATVVTEQRRDGRGTGSGSVLGGSGAVGIAAVVLGSQVVRGAGQGEALEVAWEGAGAAALEGSPWGALWAGLRSFISPPVVVEWLGKAGMWWWRSEIEGGPP